MDTPSAVSNVTLNLSGDSGVLADCVEGDEDSADLVEDGSLLQLTIRLKSSRLVTIGKEKMAGRLFFCKALEAETFMMLGTLPS